MLCWTIDRPYIRRYFASHSVLAEVTRRAILPGADAPAGQSPAIPAVTHGAPRLACVPGGAIRPTTDYPGGKLRRTRRWFRRLGDVPAIWM
jgi:hypothetical protein